MSNFTFFPQCFLCIYAVCILIFFNSHVSVVACSFFEFQTVSKWCRPIREFVKPHFATSWLNCMTLLTQNTLQMVAFSQCHKALPGLDRTGPPLFHFCHNKPHCLSGTILSQITEQSPLRYQHNQDKLEVKRIPVHLLQHDNSLVGVEPVCYRSNLCTSRGIFTHEYKRILCADLVIR